MINNSINLARLKNILYSLNQIHVYIEGHTKKSFYKNQMLVDAVMYNLIEIGRNIESLDDKYVSKYNTINWFMLSTFSTPGFVSENEIWDLVIKNKENHISSTTKNWIPQYLITINNIINLEVKKL